jgi:hypothetical protein
MGIEKLFEDKGWRGNAKWHEPPPDYDGEVPLPVVADENGYICDTDGEAETGKQIAIALRYCRELAVAISEEHRIVAEIRAGTDGHTGDRLQKELMRAEEHTKKIMSNLTRELEGLK